MKHRNNSNYYSHVILIDWNNVFLFHKKRVDAKSITSGCDWYLKPLQGKLNYVSQKGVEVSYRDVKEDVVFCLNGSWQLLFFDCVTEGEGRLKISHSGDTRKMWYGTHRWFKACKDSLYCFTVPKKSIFFRNISLDVKNSYNK